MKGLQAQTLPCAEKSLTEFLSQDVLEENSDDGSSATASFDRLCSDILGDRSFVGSPPDTLWDSTSGDESTSTSVESSPLGWPFGMREGYRLGKLQTLPKAIQGREGVVWKEREDNPEDAQLSEVELMKERFAKLLLGEDMSGGGKGVCTALAISNAITNLAASVFGELWRLEPLAEVRKARWRREMEWLLAVSDQIVEFVPSCQTLPDGSIVEVMVTKARTDLQINLPALRKLDTMLIESLDTFNRTEFWYTDRAMAEKDGALSNRHEEKWWLPTPRVPSRGLSWNTRKQLKSHRDCINQVLKAALAINGQVLSEMEVPNAYWEALPKNGRSSLGEVLYRIITSGSFFPEALVSALESCKEHNVQELLNRVEAAVHIWRQKFQAKHTDTIQKEGKSSTKPSWSLQKDLTDLDRREVLVERVESLYLLLRQKFPGLPQTILDINKIQYNKDVGKSILESYSRVLESLASNIISRIDDVLSVDNLTKHPQSSEGLSKHSSTNKTISNHITPLVTQSVSPALSQYSTEALDASPGVAAPTAQTLSNTTLSNYMGWHLEVCSAVQEKPDNNIRSNPPLPVGSHKSWSYLGYMNAQQSPRSRD